jgi:hypothetical protein
MATAQTLEQLRARSLRVPALRPGSACPVTPLSRIHLPGSAVVDSHGQGPFYFGPFGPAWTAGDLNKTPWAVDSRYAGAVVVRGRQLDGPGVVAFGFWPLGFGTPAGRPDVPVLFQRPDQQGRMVVYQPELDLDPISPTAWRTGGHFWSLPSQGCYAIQADGDTFTEVTIVQVF